MNKHSCLFDSQNTPNNPTTLQVNLPEEGLVVVNIEITLTGATVPGTLLDIEIKACLEEIGE